MFAGWLSTKISRILGLRELIDIPLLNKRCNRSGVVVHL
jgi:hypothetical protein